MRTILHTSLLFLAMAAPGHALEETKKALLQEALGALAGSVLINTFEELAALEDGWRRGTHNKEEALALAAACRDQVDVAIAALELFSDLPESTDITATDELLQEQVTTLETWIRTGDDSHADSYEKIKLAVSDHFFGPEETPAPGAAAPAVVKFEIIRSTKLDGSPGPLGTMTITEKAKDQAAHVLWEYADGTTEEGWAVGFPGGEDFAVGFGSGLGIIGGYERRTTGIEGRWVFAKEESTVKLIEMSPGDSDTEYHFENGSRFTIKSGSDNRAEVTWHLPAGDVPGIAVIDGPFIAVLSFTQETNGGIALYSATGEEAGDEVPDVSGLWITTGVAGTGTEELRFIPSSPQKKTGGALLLQDLLQDLLQKPNP